jgi:hypothetical protein
MRSFINLTTPWGDCGGFGLPSLEDGRVLISYYGRANRSKRLENAFEYGKMRLKLAGLKEVRADSVEGRVR